MSSRQASSSTYGPPIHRLPAEILGPIFKLAVDNVESWEKFTPEHLSYVCRRWHDAAVAHVVLWSRVNLTHNTQRVYECTSLVPYTRRRLHRSRKALLDIKVIYRNEEWHINYLPAFLECIGKHGDVMRRWRSLYLSGYHVPIPVMDLLCYPTPKLHELVFDCHQDTKYDTSHMLPLTPKLRTVKLSNGKHSSSSFRYPRHTPRTVTHLQITSHDIEFACHAIRPFTSIRVLRLHIFHSRTGGWPLTFPAMTIFPHLRDLRTDSVRRSLALLMNISTPALTHLRLCLNQDSEEDAPSILAAFGPVLSQITHLEIQALHCQSPLEFAEFLRKFGNLKELHVNGVGRYMEYRERWWPVANEDYSGVLEDPSLCIWLERCVVAGLVRDDLVKSRSADGESLWVCELLASEGRSNLRPDYRRCFDHAPGISDQNLGSTKTIEWSSE
jgi:hypothetical protein